MNRFRLNSIPSLADHRAPHQQVQQMTENTRSKSTTGERKTDKLIDAMVMGVAGELARNGIDKDRADRIARKAITTLCQQIGGIEVYIPTTPKKVPRTERAAEILAGWRAGLSFDELAERYEISERWVRVLFYEARAASHSAEQLPA